MISKIKMERSSASHVQHWMVSGKLNIINIVLDRHIRSGVRNKTALIWEGEPGDFKVLTYKDLNRQVCKFANVLKLKGVEKGDVVTIFMPQIPELLYAMLATAKIGAVHNVIYGNLDSNSLVHEISQISSRILITADGTWREGKVVDLKAVVNEALEKISSIKNCIVVERTSQKIKMLENRDFFYTDLLSPFQNIEKCETISTDASDPLFIAHEIDISGSTQQKTYTHGGYEAYLQNIHQHVSNIDHNDRWWFASNFELMVGLSSVIYAPLIDGATIILYEGDSNYPIQNRWLRLVEKYEVTHFYPSPKS